MKKRTVSNMIFNVVFNSVLALIFVMLNGWALQSHLEETFVTLAIFYGLIVIGGNALFFLPNITHN